MRVLVLGHNLSRTGAPRSLLNVLTGLRAHHGFEFMVLVNYPGPMAQEYVRAGFVPHYFIPWWRLRNSSLLARAWYRFYLRRLAGQVRRFAPSVIYANTVATHHILRWLGRVVSVPVVMHVRELQWGIEREGGAGLVKWLDGRVLVFLCVSGAVAELLCSYGVAGEKCVRVPNFVEGVPAGLSKKEQKMRWFGDAAVIGVVGGFGAGKGLELLPEVVAQVVGRAHQPVKFLVVGSGYYEVYRQVRTEVERRGLAPYVVFVGEVVERWHWWQQIDIHLHLALEDPAPLVVLEAMEVGIPTVCFDGSGGATEMVVDGQTGFIVANGDVSAMVERLLRLVGDLALRSSMGERAQLRRRRFFTADISLATIARALREGVGALALH